MLVLDIGENSVWRAWERMPRVKASREVRKRIKNEANKLESYFVDTVSYDPAVPDGQIEVSYAADIIVLKKVR